MIIVQCPGCSGLQYAAFNTVADLIANTDTSIIQAAVLDPIRGGTFDLYSGPDAADGGMVFEDSSSQKWLRQTDSNDPKINVQWYGAMPSETAVNNLAFFGAARDYVDSHDKFDTLYIPQGEPGSGGWYTFDDTLEFTKSIKLLGDGTIGDFSVFPLFIGRMEPSYSLVTP